MLSIHISVNGTGNKGTALFWAQTNSWDVMGFSLV